MALETGTYVQDLVTTNPTTNDPVSQGDDHLRLIKALLDATFPNASKAFYFPTTSASKVSGDSPVTVAATDENVLFRANATGGAITFNLPAAATAGSGFTVGFVKTDSSSNAVTLDGNGAETIGGATTTTLTKQNQAVLIRSDGTNWQFVSERATGALRLLDTVSATEIASNAVTTAKILDSNVTTAKIADDNVTLAKLDHGNNGEILYYAAAGAPTRLAAGTSGQFLKSNGAAAPSWAADAFAGALLHVRDAKGSGTDGGTFSSGADRTRTLNTTMTNEISGASLASNQISLPAGTYYVYARAPANQVQNHQAFLYNVTDTADILRGSTVYASSGGAVVNDSIVQGRFTIAGTKTIELRHRCQTSKTSDGFGLAASFGTEVYADVVIWKL